MACGTRSDHINPSWEQTAPEKEHLWLRAMMKFGKQYRSKRTHGFCGTLEELSTDRWRSMKALVPFSGSVPLLILTSYKSAIDPQVHCEAGNKGHHEVRCIGHASGCHCERKEVVQTDHGKTWRVDHGFSAACFLRISPNYLHMACPIVTDPRESLCQFRTGE